MHYEPGRHHGRRRGRHHHGGRCACGSHRGFHRRFRTKAEKIAGLEEYLVDLRKEATAVEERIAELQGE